MAERLVADPPMPTGQPGRDELWPVVTARSSLYLTRNGGDFVDSPGGAGLNLTAAFDPRQVGTGRFSGSVLRALLYAHGLVIEDPLVMAADMYLSVPAEVRHIARAGIETAVTNLVEIEHLLDEGVVETYFPSSVTKEDGAAIAGHIERRLAGDSNSFEMESIWETFEADFVDGLSPHLKQLWELIRGGDRSPDLDLVRAAAAEGDPLVSTFIEVVGSLRRDDVLTNAVHAVSQTMADAAHLGGRHDFLASSPLMARLVAIGSTEGGVPARLLELGRTDVPRLDDLSMADIVRIRENSQTLDRWRHHLTLALEQAHQLRSSGGTDRQIANAVRQIIAEARAQVVGETGRSDLPHQSSAQLVTFAAGMFGGAVGGSADGTPSVVAGAVGAGLAGTIAALGQRWARPPAFLRRHYVLFEPRR